MKIFTDKAYREQIEKIKYEHERERYVVERLDRLTEELHQLEWRVQTLECNPIPVAETTCEPSRRRKERQ